MRKSLQHTRKGPTLPSYYNSLADSMYIKSSDDAFLTDVRQPVAQRHLCKAAPFGRPVFSGMVQIVQVVHVRIGFYLERIKIVAGVFHLPEIAQRLYDIP